MFIEEITGNKKIDYRAVNGMGLEEFVEAVSEYDSLESALEQLDEEYREWFYENCRSKDLQKALRHKKIPEKPINEDTEEPMLGLSRYNARVTSGKKYIHYKGDYISFQYDQTKATWQPNPEFRSIVDAIRYAKYEMEKYKEWLKSK